MILETLTVQALRVRAVNVPMSLPLVTGGGSVSAAPPQWGQPMRENTVMS